jgi:GxxExxY protein
MTNEEIRQVVIGSAYRVHNQLGAGFVEKVYENAMCLELADTGLRVRQQAPIHVRYKGVVVGEFMADLLVEDTIIWNSKRPVL